MRIKGLRDIKTHSSLAREGRLISVWKIEQPIYKKKGLTRIFSPLERRKIRLYQIAVTRDLLEEIHRALAEGFPVAKHEFERLEIRLAELQAE